MKQAFINYGLNFILALIILWVGGLLIEQGKTFYNTYAPIEDFYVNESLIVEDVCVGDTSQNVVSTRFVNKNVDGYESTVIKELFLVQVEGNVKVYDEFRTPFIEKVENGIVYRVQQLPPWLEAGQYQWVMKVTLTVGNVVRDDVPLIESNIFNVKVCDM